MSTDTTTPPSAPAARTPGGRAATLVRRSSWVFAFAVVVSAVVQTFIGWDNFTDLDVYQSSAQGLREGQSLYGQGFGSVGLPFTYPPFAALVFLPFTLLPFVPLGVLWFALSVALLVDACVSLRQWGDREGWRPVPPLLVAAGALVLEPVTSTLGFGQVNLLLLALLLRDASGRLPRWLPQGVLTGLCAGFKLTPAAFGLYYLMTGRIAALRNAALAGMGTVLAAALVLPEESRTFWLEATFADPSRPGAPWYIYNQSLAGMFTRWLPTDTGATVATVASVPVVILAGWLAWRLHRESRNLLAFATVTLVPLLISPISWTHHWVSMIVPLLALVAAPWRTQARARYVLAGVTVFLLASRAMNVLPREADRELTYGPLAELLSASYTLAALAFLAFVTYEVTLAPRRGVRLAGKVPHGAGSPPQSA